MEPPARPDVVCLHLAEYVGHQQADAAPAAVTPAGIAAATGLDDDRIRDRLALLSTLDELQDRGLVEEAVRTVEGAGGRRRVYFATAAGRERAEEVRERVTGEEVIVSDGSGAETVPLERAAAYFEDASLVDVLASLDEEGRLALPGDGEAAFVGREDVLDRFDAALSAAETQGSRTLLVVGSAGVGKTELLDEVADRADSLGFELLHGAGRRDVLDPFGPLRRAFAGAFEDDVLERLSAADGPEDAAAFRAGRNALFYEVREALTERATEGPLLVALDDLQWADRPTLELFAHLAETVTEWIYPVLFVAAYRPEAVREDDPLAETTQRLAAADRVERLRLEPLSDHETRTLLGRLTGDPGVPGSFVDLVHSTTGGNPLFVRATVSKLLEEGLVDPAAGEYPTDRNALDVPRAVRDAVEERLAMLDDRGRRVLRAGSVVGETVPRELLVAALDLPEPDVLEYADLLVGAGVWERTGDGYRFDSGVLREAVLSSLPDAVATELHGAVAEALPTTGRGDEAAIARHYEAAGDAGAALGHYRRAGERAASMYAHEVARDAYRSALELAREGGDRAAEADLLERLGEVQFRLGDFEAAEAAFGALRERATDAAAVVRAHHRSGEMCVKRGDYGTAREHASEGLAAADDGGVAGADRCGILRMQGWALMQAGDLKGARETFERERAAADTDDDGAAVGVALHDLGTVDGKSGEFHAAEDHLAAAVDRLEAAGDRRHLAKALTNLALVHRHLGDLAAASEEIERALSIQRELGVEEGLPTALLNLGVVQRARGELPAAVETFRDGLAAARRVGREQKAANARSDLSAALLDRGELVEAREHAERAVATCDELGHRDGEALARAALARARLVGGDRDGAREAAASALRVARELGNKDRVGDALAVRGQLHRFDGDLAAARECHEEGLALMEDSGNAGLALANRVGLAGDCQAAGDLETAKEHCEVALDDVGDDDVLRGRVRARLGAIHRRRGDLAAAETALTAARETLADRAASTHVARVLLELAELALAREDPEAARAHVDEAASLAADCRAELYVGLADELRQRL